MDVGTSASTFARTTIADRQPWNSRALRGISELMRHALLLGALVLTIGLVVACEAEEPVEVAAPSASAAEPEAGPEEGEVLPRVPRRRAAETAAAPSVNEADDAEEPALDADRLGEELAKSLAEATARKPGDPPAEDGGLADLLDEAQGIVTRRGEDALLDARSPQPRPVPVDRILRGWVEEFAETREAHRAWALAQLIRFDDHHHYGRFWMHDEVAWNGMVEIAKGHADPLHRWLAIDALGEHGGVAKEALLGDADVRVRAVAARHLPAPDRASRDEAEEITDAVLELVRSLDPRVRAMAVVGLARWSHTATHRRTVKRMALSDDDARARAGAIRALPSLGFEHAVEVLQQYRSRSGLSEDEQQALREVRNWLPIQVVDEP